MEPTRAPSAAVRPRVEARTPPRPSSRRFGGYVALGAALAALAVAAVSTTREEAARGPHQGAAGLKHTTKGAEVRWRLQSTTVRIDSSLSHLGSGAENAVKQAFTTWTQSEAALPRVKFETTSKAEAQAAPDGKNTVVLAPITVKGHEHDLAITLTYSDEQTGDIVEADIVVNSEYPFKLLAMSAENDLEDDDSSNGNGSPTTTTGTQPSVNSARASCQATAKAPSCDGGAYDLQNVVTHEVGHFFGLGEDMDDATSTMYYCTSRCETHKRVLTNDDTTVMNVLYAPSTATDGSPASAGGCGGARIAPRGGLAASAWMVATALLGLTLRRRRAR
ncbi:MAG TPA: matrixin family metalloprotease [Polyangiaceae bacterium]|nr:matrixin family metalloprotease [Polyangiaceae bacterium]